MEQALGYVKRPTLSERLDSKSKKNDRKVKEEKVEVDSVSSEQDKTGIVETEGEY